MKTTASGEGIRVIGDEARRRAAEDLADWERRELASSIARQPERAPEFRSASGIPLHRTYTPAEAKAGLWGEIGLPGRYPFTRGPYPTMFRGRLWTMRQIAGYGTPEDTNERFKYLIAEGQTGLSVDFDMPTLMGYDSDDDMSSGEVGREGVAVDVLDDMEALFAGIDLEKTSVSMTINPTAWILLAMYVSVAQGRGNDPRTLSGTIQNDILKEYVAQKEWIYPIRPSMRIVRDTIGGRCECDPGGRVHARQRDRLRRRGGPRRRAGRRFRAQACVLLHRAARLLRGDREVPCRPARVGEDHEGALRGYPR